MDPLPDQNYKKSPNFYIRELDSEQCLCERPKWRGRSFCYNCYKSLPPDMQRALYRRIGEGYEEAYETAVKWLTEAGHIE